MIVYDFPRNPCLTTLPGAVKCCQELFKCACNKACTRRCKFVEANLEWTQLCFCSGQCNRERENSSEDNYDILVIMF